MSGRTWIIARARRVVGSVLSRMTRRQKGTGAPHGSDAGVERLLLELAYLTEMPEVAFYDVDGNTVFIHFHARTAGADLIVRDAALRADRRLGSGAHAWGIVGGSPAWRPGDQPGSFSEHSCWGGRIQD